MLFKIPGSQGGGNTGGSSPGIGSSSGPDSLTRMPLGTFSIGAKGSLAELQPHVSFNQRFQMVAASADVAMKFIGFQIVPGLTVTLFGFNGSANNGKQITFGELASLGHAGQHYLAPGEAISHPVDDLAEIWWMAAQAGDGLLITVTGESVG